MKKKVVSISSYFYLLLACISLLLACVVVFSSCTNESNVPPALTEDSIVPLGISDASLTVSKTRATSILTTAGSQIGLFLTGTGYTALNNVLYSYSTGWSSLAPIYLSKSVANICAYYPYNAAFTTPTLSMVPKAYAAASDICFQANQTASVPSATSISLVLIRAYSKLTLAISKAASYPSTGNITSMTIANTGLITSSNLNMTTAAYATVTTAGTFTDAAPAIANLATAVNKEYLMVPSTLSGANTTLTLVIDGNTLTGTIPNTTMAALVAGSNHTITVTISGTSLTISSVSTTDWATGTGASVNPS